MWMRMVAGLYQKTPEIDLLSLVKNPAVATAAFCEPFPTVTPTSAAAPQRVGPWSASGAATAIGCTAGGGRTSATGVTGAGRFPVPNGCSSTMPSAETDALLVVVTRGGEKCRDAFWRVRRRWDWTRGIAVVRAAAWTFAWPTRRGGARNGRQLVGEDGTTPIGRRCAGRRRRMRRAARRPARRATSPRARRWRRPARARRASGATIIGAPSVALSTCCGAFEQPDDPRRQFG